MHNFILTKNELPTPEFKNNAHQKPLIRAKLLYHQAHKNMFIKVQPFNGPPQPLTYKVDVLDSSESILGTIVQVPLQNRIIYGLVIDEGEHLGHNVPFTIKNIIALEKLPHDNQYQKFIQTLAHYYQLEPTSLLRRLQQFLSLNQTSEPELNIPKEINFQPVRLTDEQEQIVNALMPHLQQSSYQPTLIHGVTSSGKTEIYKKLILGTLTHNKTVIVMLPEVSLALEFEHIFKRTLTHAPIFSFHSASNKPEKNNLWRALLDQKPLVIIGVHQPIMLPVANLGLIIVDEEHETGYQEKKHPHISSKEAALIRAHQYKIPIILGSATPSVTSLYNVHKRNWNFFTLTKRYKGAFPKIDIVYLSQKQKRRNFWISQELDQAISNRLSKKEQIIIFINRRGFSFFVQCKNCGNSLKCSRCSVSLTPHSGPTANDISLRCHYCNAHKRVPTECPQCHEKELLKKGIGTQQAVHILQKLYPSARIARADLDTTRKKKEWLATISQFNNQEIDILVGTQTITKGYHFPNVTLVGILWADLNIHLPHYNAAERTLQQLLQVAGRAGRERHDSQVIVQAMAQHQIFEYINEQDYLKFSEKELDQRLLLNYPPCGRFAEIEFIHRNEAVVIRESLTAVNFIQNLKKNNLTILGPVEPPVAKIQGIYRKSIFLKAPVITIITDAYKELKKHKFNSTLHFNPSV